MPVLRFTVEALLVGGYTRLETYEYRACELPHWLGYHASLAYRPPISRI
ncbi:hypothetical protein [Lysobacter sp. A378]